MKKSTGPLRFVLLEDDPNDAELIQLQLAKDGIEVDWRHVVAERDFREALAGAPPDLVLADYTLPGFDGLAALKILLQHSPDIPFIFVSGSLGEERAIEALKSGATDYVLKDRLQRLPAVVMRALLEARERRERREAQSALEEQRMLLGTLIDSLPEIIYAVDTSNRVKVVNKALLDTLGRRRDQVIGRTLSEISNDENVVDIEAQAATTMRTGRALTDQERAWISADGSVRWFTYTHVPLRDHGTVSGLVCTVQEVTTRRELEQEILEISNREQRRLGSDLHDGLGQELTGLSLLLKGLELQLSRESPQYTSHITKITDLLAHAIQSTRSLARGLAPVNLERGGLPEALKHLAARCTDMYSLPVHVRQRLAEAAGSGGRRGDASVSDRAGSDDQCRALRAREDDCDRPAIDGTQAAAIDRGRRHRPVGGPGATPPGHGPEDHGISRAHARRHDQFRRAQPGHAHRAVCAAASAAAIEREVAKGGVVGCIAPARHTVSSSSPSLPHHRHERVIRAVPDLDEVLDLRRGHRRGDEVALHRVAGALVEELEHRRRLDAFGTHGERRGCARGR